RIMGRPRALVTVLAGALLLAGCASGPSQVGAAVIFKDRSLSVNDVQGLIDKAVREQPYAQKLASEHKLDLIGREIVRQQVVHELLTAAAPQLNTAASDPLIAQALSQDPFGQPVGADVSDQASAVTAVVHSVRDHREAVTDLVQQRVLAAQTIPKLSVTLDYIPVQAGDPASGRAQAVDMAQQFAAAPDGIQKYAQKSGQQSRNLKLAAIQDPVNAGTAVFGAPVNSAIAVQVTGDQGPFWIAAVIRARADNQQVATDQTQQPTSEQLDTIGIRLLQPYLDQIGLRVNPRYGVWDVVGMNLAPNQAAIQ